MISYNSIQTNRRTEKIKKFIVFTLVAAMAVSMLVLVSCGGEKEDLSDSKYVGTWKISKISIADESDQFDENWTLEISGDGTGKSISDEETNEFTWKPVDGGFKTKGDLKLTFKDDGDNIAGNLFGVKLIFEKQ